MKHIWSHMFSDYSGIGHHFVDKLLFSQWPQGGRCLGTSSLSLWQHICEHVEGVEWSNHQYNPLMTTVMTTSTFIEAEFNRRYLSGRLPLLTLRLRRINCCCYKVMRWLVLGWNDSMSCQPDVPQIYLTASHVVSCHNVLSSSNWHNLHWTKCNSTW